LFDQAWSTPGLV